MSDSSYAVFPAIGIARVGNAPKEFYIGPETYRGLPILPDDAAGAFRPEHFRDRERRLRRQAARFRIYRAKGNSADEVTLDTPGVKEIRWTVHLANKKASWYQFLTTKGQHGYAPNHPLRNADVTTPEQRRKLIIDPGPRHISGTKQGGPGKSVEFSRSTIPPGYTGGSFPPETLDPSIDTLGELQMDAQGRLLVLGGFGQSISSDSPRRISHFANNDGWWDDTSDGPVWATIFLESGESLKAMPGWVLVAPPAYAPQIPNLVTLYDTIFDVAVRHQQWRPDIYENGHWKHGPDGYQPYFDSDIRPIFERATGHTWVTALPPKPHTFDDLRLGNPDETLNSFRKFFLDVIRPPGGENQILNSVSAATMMPYIAGDDALGASDAAGASKATSKYLRLTDTQYFLLQQWAEGRFKRGSGPQDSHKGRQLTRAVLENCVGGGFSPGIETTWISRDPRIYSEPFRIRVREEIRSPLSLGFDPAVGLEPGDLTRYMAVPWQADFNLCSSQPIEGRTLWWWPAQRPEFVHRFEDKRQVPWVGTADDQTAPDYISFVDSLEMVDKWHQLGFVYNIGTAEEPQFAEVVRTLTDER